MAEAGFAEIAGAVPDEINPTSLRDGPASESDEVGAVNTKLGNDDV
jgi:hypothetical protein